MKEKETKKETDTELLARLIAEGFVRVDARLDGRGIRFDGVDDWLLSLEKGQAETLHRLDSIKKKQTGTLASLDEVVHRSEFVKLAHRVEVLEKS